MARWFFVTFLVACLLCVIQAYPQGDSSSDLPSTDKIVATLNDIAATLQRNLQELMQDPTVNKLVTDGQTLLTSAATAIQTEASKMMPKTDEKPSV